MEEEILSLDLNDPNKVQRKKNLLRFKELLEASDSGLDRPRIWSESSLSLFRRLQDEAERTREAAAQAILLFYAGSAEYDDGADRGGEPWIGASDLQLHYLVPVLRSRLAGDDPREPSEEVRAALAAVLLAAVSRGEAGPHAEDVAAALGACLADSYARVKLVAARAVAAAAGADGFASGAPGLVGPLLRNLPHQQRKVRVASVKALGEVNLKIFVASEQIGRAHV